MSEQFNQDKVEHIRNLFNLGYKIMDIAKTVGVSRSTVKNYKKKYNMNSNYINRCAKTSEDKVQQIRELESKGLGTKAICKQTGLGESAVRKYKNFLKPQRNNMIYEEGKLPQDKIDQILNLVDQSYDPSAIAKKLEISGGTVRNYIKKFRSNIELRPKIEAISEDKLNVMLALINKGFNTKEISEIVQVSIWSVNKYRKKYRLENNNEEAPKLPKLSNSTIKIITALSNKGFSKKEIAETAEVSISTVSRYLNKDRSSNINKACLGKKISQDKINTIIELNAKGNNIREISKAVWVSKTTVSRHLKKHKSNTNPNEKEKPIISKEKMNMITDLAKQGDKEEDTADAIEVSRDMFEDTN